VLTNTQLQDLAELHRLAEQFAAGVAIIGAAALQCFFDMSSLTRDVDLVVALDLEDFAVLADALKTRGWTREEPREHRWYGPSGSLVDLLPAGPKLCQAKRIVWPESEFEMSLVGFEHVFARAIPFSFAEGVQYRVAPPIVIALLKIIAFMDDPHRREKDLNHLAEILGRYEDESDRIFCDEVYAAELDDIEYANAFLLGMDIATIAMADELEIVEEFLDSKGISDEELDDLVPDDMRQRAELRFQRQLRAFRKGLERDRKS